MLIFHEVHTPSVDACSKTTSRYEGGSAGTLRTDSDNGETDCFRDATNVVEWVSASLLSDVTVFSFCECTSLSFKRWRSTSRSDLFFSWPDAFLWLLSCVQSLRAASVWFEADMPENVFFRASQSPSIQGSTTTSSLERKESQSLTRQYIRKSKLFYIVIQHSCLPSAVICMPSGIEMFSTKSLQKAVNGLASVAEICIVCIS